MLFSFLYLYANTKTIRKKKINNLKMNYTIFLIKI